LGCVRPATHLAIMFVALGQKRLDVPDLNYMPHKPSFLPQEENHPPPGCDGFESNGRYLL
jgi:hypothetical protein